MRGAKYKKKRKQRAAAFESWPGQIPKEERVKAGKANFMIKRAQAVAAYRAGEDQICYDKATVLNAGDAAMRN